MLARPIFPYSFRSTDSDRFQFYPINNTLQAMASRRPCAKNGSLAFPPCTDSALQIKKGIYIVPFPHPYQQVSSFRHSLAPSLLHLIRLLHRGTALLDSLNRLACTKITRASPVLLKTISLRPKAISSLFLFLSLSSTFERRRGRSGVWDFSNYYPLYRWEPISLLVESVVIKSERGHFFLSVLLFFV